MKQRKRGIVVVMEWLRMIRHIDRAVSAFVRLPEGSHDGRESIRAGAGAAPFANYQPVMAGGDLVAQESMSQPAIRQQQQIRTLRTEPFVNLRNRTMEIGRRRDSLPQGDVGAGSPEQPGALPPRGLDPGIDFLQCRSGMTRRIDHRLNPFGLEDDAPCCVSTAFQIGDAYLVLPGPQLSPAPRQIPVRGSRR
jgi:hypothetical protein